MPVSMEICNNGTSVLDHVGSSLVKSLVIKTDLVQKKKSKKIVLCYILNVDIKDIILKSVKILHLLISISKFNLLMFLKEKPFTYTTYHVSMD